MPAISAETCIEVLRHTHDGNDLATDDLRVIERVLNNRPRGDEPHNLVARARDLVRLKELHDKWVPKV